MPDGIAKRRGVDAGAQSEEMTEPGPLGVTISGAALSDHRVGNLSVVSRDYVATVTAAVQIVWRPHFPSLTPVSPLLARSAFV
jgi:hypothetical protein